MMPDMPDQNLIETNQFYREAQRRWSGGEDGEAIARELAKALAAVIIEGTKPVGHKALAVEFLRLAFDGQTDNAGDCPICDAPRTLEDRIVRAINGAF